MGFRKTSVGLTPASQIASPFPQIGEEKDGKVWNGTGWVSQAEWDQHQDTAGSQLPGVVPEATTLKDA